MLFFRKKTFIIISIVLLFSIITTINATLNIIESNSNYTIIELALALDTVLISNKIVGDENFKTVNVDGFGTLARIGFPLLPYRGISIATNWGVDDIKIEIIEQKFSIINNCNIYPTPRSTPAVLGMDSGDVFTQNDSIYSVNEYYPEKVASVHNIQSYRGIPVATIGFTPVQFNPINKKLRYCKKLKVKIS